LAYTPECKDKTLDAIKNPKSITVSVLFAPHTKPKILAYKKKGEFLLTEREHEKKRNENKAGH